MLLLLLLLQENNELYFFVILINNLIRKRAEPIVKFAEQQITNKLYKTIYSLLAQRQIHNFFIHSFKFRL